MIGADRLVCSRTAVMFLFGDGSRAYDRAPQLA
jgi:hypothetical protein